MYVYLKRTVQRLESEIVDGELSGEVDEARAGAWLPSRVGEVGEGGGGGEEEEGGQGW